VGLVVALGALGELVFEALLLLDRIVQLAEGVAQLEAAAEELETLDVRRVVRLGLRERRNLDRVVVDDVRLNEERLDDRLEEVINGLAQRRESFSAPQGALG
jgi:hypothetical protein